MTIKAVAFDPRPADWWAFVWRAAATSVAAGLIVGFASGSLTALAGAPASARLVGSVLGWMACIPCIVWAYRHVESSRPAAAAAAPEHAGWLLPAALAFAATVVMVILLSDSSFSPAASWVSRLMQPGPAASTPPAAETAPDKKGGKKGGKKKHKAKTASRASTVEDGDTVGA